MKLAWLAFAASIFSTAGIADPSNNKGADGNYLLPACTSMIQRAESNAFNFDSRDGYCMGLIHAIIDIGSSNPEGVFRFCPPNGTITTGQAAKVVVQFLKTHPKVMGERDTTLAFFALKQAYPCK